MNKLAASIKMLPPKDSYPDDFSEVINLPTHMSDGQVVNFRAQGDNLSGRDLNGYLFFYGVMDGVVLSRAKLNKARFSEVQIKDSNLAGAELRGSLFTDEDTGKSIIFNSNLGGAKLDKSSFLGTKFNKSNFQVGDELSKIRNLTNCVFRLTNLSGVTLSTGPNYTGTKFLNCNFNDATISDINLSQEGIKVIRSCSFKGATVSGLDASKSNLSNVDFSEGANISNSDFSTLQLGKSKFEGCSVTNTDFSDVDFSQLDKQGLSSSVFTECKFVYADMLRIKAVGSTFHSCDFEYADAPSSNFQNSELILDADYVNFESADLSGSTIRGSFFKSLLKGANLSSCNLVDIILKEANLTGANLNSLRAFSGVDLEGANLSKARMDRGTWERIKIAIPEIATFEEGSNSNYLKSIKGSDIEKYIKEDRFEALKIEVAEERVRREKRLRTEEANRQKELARQEIEKRQREAIEHASLIEDFSFRVNRTKKHRDAKGLAVELGSLMADPKTTSKQKRALEVLKADLESKYTWFGNLFDKLFRRGRRATQMRVASQMLAELHREIEELKRDQ